MSGPPSRSPCRGDPRAWVALILAVGVGPACATQASSSVVEAESTPPAPRPPRRPGDAGSSAGREDLDEAIKLADAGDLEGAIRRSREAIEKNPVLEKAYLLLGSACSMKDDTECEKNAYEFGVTALPHSPALLNERGLFRLRSGAKKEAVEDLERAHELSGRKDAKLMADLAYGYIFVDRLDEAQSLAEQARRADPKSVEAAMSQGEVLLHRKDGKNAAVAFETAEALTSDREVKLRLRRRRALALSMDNQPKAAFEIYEALLKENGANDDPMLHVETAGALMRLNRAKDAVTHMENAIKIAPDDVRFLSLLLQAQEKAGDKRGAQTTKKRLSALGVK